MYLGLRFIKTFIIFFFKKYVQYQKCFWFLAGIWTNESNATLQVVYSGYQNNIIIFVDIYSLLPEDDLLCSGCQKIINLFEFKALLKL